MINHEKKVLKSKKSEIISEVSDFGNGALTIFQLKMVEKEWFQRFRN